MFKDKNAIFPFKLHRLPKRDVNQNERILITAESEAGSASLNFDAGYFTSNFILLDVLSTIDDTYSLMVQVDNEKLTLAQGLSKDELSQAKAYLVNQLNDSRFIRHEVREQGSTWIYGPKPAVPFKTQYAVAALMLVVAVGGFYIASNASNKMLYKQSGIEESENRKLVKSYPRHYYHHKEKYADKANALVEAEPFMLTRGARAVKEKQETDTTTDQVRTNFAKSEQTAMKVETERLEELNRLREELQKAKEGVDRLAKQAYESDKSKQVEQVEMKARSRMGNFDKMASTVTSGLTTNVRTAWFLSGDTNALLQPLIEEFSINLSDNNDGEVVYLFSDMNARSLPALDLTVGLETKGYSPRLIPLDFLPEYNSADGEEVEPVARVITSYCSSNGLSAWVSPEKTTEADLAASLLEVDPKPCQWETALSSFLMAGEIIEGEFDTSYPFIVSPNGAIYQYESNDGVTPSSLAQWLSLNRPR